MSNTATVMKRTFNQMNESSEDEWEYQINESSEDEWEDQINERSEDDWKKRCKKYNEYDKKISYGRPSPLWREINTMISRGNLQYLKSIEKRLGQKLDRSVHYHAPNYEFICRAVRSGNIALVKWLSERNFASYDTKFGSETFIYGMLSDAIREEDFIMLRWLMDNYTQPESLDFLWEDVFEFYNNVTDENGDKDDTRKHHGFQWLINNKIPEPPNVNWWYEKCLEPYNHTSGFYSYAESLGKINDKGFQERIYDLIEPVVKRYLDLPNPKEKKLANTLQNKTNLFWSKIITKELNHRFKDGQPSNLKFMKWLLYVVKLPPVVLTNHTLEKDRYYECFETRVVGRANEFFSWYIETQNLYMSKEVYEWVLENFPKEEK